MSNKYVYNMIMKKEETFINKAIKIHGKLYDYSRFVYITNKVKGTIICHEHGLFEQRPNDHLQNHGCPKCGNKTISKKASSNKEDFIKKALSVHKKRYDYSKIEYIDYRTKIKIICKEHGVFYQSPCVHVTGSGCQQCGKNKYITALTSNKEEFVKNSIQVHGEQYDYSDFIYVGSHTKGKIMCQQHGVFEQTPDHHLKGHACSSCGLNKSKQLRTFDKEEFIIKSKQKHGDFYDYSLVEYNGSHEKVKIICKKHGIYEQKAYSHWQGIGCPSCSHNVSKLETAWLSELDIPLQNHSIKFGNKRVRKVDGYDPLTNTVYQFHGDYWHGNPEKFNPNDINQKTKKSFGELYNQTLQNDELIRNSGYNLVIMWESDYIQSKEINL